MMDWVASRLHKAGAAVWAIIFNLDVFYTSGRFYF
jgi:hypothetical protein